MGGRRRGHRDLAVALVAAGLLATACGSSTTTSTSATTVDPAVGGTPPATAAGTDPAATTVAADGGSAADPAPPDPGAQRNPGGAYGEYGIYERVNFPAGTSGTTLSDGVAQGTVNGYLLRAAAGQRMTITLDGLNALFDAYGPDDGLLAMGDSGGTPVVIDPLPAGGDYLVVVSSVRGGTGYDLTIEITSPSGSTTSASCATYTEFASDYPLRMCHKGGLVRDVQQALKDLGYDVDVDGFFGPGTAAALADYFDDGIAELMPPDVETLLGTE